MPKLNRRAAIGGGIAAAVALIEVASELAGVGISSLLPDIPNKFHSDGSLVVLPDSGTSYVASDFRGRFDEFDGWLKDTDIEARLRSEDVYALILGDVVSLKNAVEDGDKKILDKIQELQTSRRFILTNGNYEIDAVENFPQYQKMVSQLGAKRANKVYGYFNKSEKFNFLQRIDLHDFNYLDRRPSIVYANNGVVFVHGGPPQRYHTLEDIKAPAKQTRHDMAWRRPDDTGVNGYTHEEALAFLKMFDSAGLMVTEHPPKAPIETLATGRAGDGIAYLGDHQAILSAAYSEAKPYLVIDLTKRVKNNNSIQQNVKFLKA